MRNRFAMRAVTLPALSAMVALASACSSGGGTRAQRGAATLAGYEAHAGAPVDHFRYSNSINGWTTLGDSAIAVWTRPSEAWLLYFHGPCQDIGFTPAISITNSTGRVSARFDRVLVHGRSSIQLPCIIREIRPLDVNALRAERRQDTAAATADGAATSGDPR